MGRQGPKLYGDTPVLDSSLLDWLEASGGAVLLWRSACLRGCEIPTAELLASPGPREWLPRLNLDGFSTPLDRLDPAALGQLGGRVHGSKAECLENVFGKLAEFGLRAGLPALDERALPLMAIFCWQPDWDTTAVYQHAWENLTKTVFAWGLLRLGYSPDPAMKAAIRSHLRDCWKIARDQVFDIYASPAELAGLPKAWLGKPILRQEVMRSYWLPTIQDVFLFANLPPGLLDAAEEQMLAEWVRYLADPRFQALREGYGYAWIPERRTCYSWGWSPHLPGNNGFGDLAGGPVTPLLSRLELLARLPAGRSSAWLGAAMGHLETFRLSSGHFRFPSNYLHEGPGYYVCGYGMGLGENRRNPAWAELESTLRMLHLQALLSQSGDGGSSGFGVEEVI